MAALCVLLKRANAERASSQRDTELDAVWAELEHRTKKKYTLTELKEGIQ